MNSQTTAARALSSPPRPHGRCQASDDSAMRDGGPSCRESYVFEKCESTKASGLAVSGRIGVVTSPFHAMQVPVT
jgi:hypothetical protein